MNTGSVLAQFTITLSKAVSEPVAVEWFTTDGTAKAGVDYAANKGIAIFQPGQTEKKVDILVYGRAVGSEDRTFFVEMLPPTNAILGASVGECIIHVDTTGSQPVTQIIVPTGPKGDEGKSSYQSWLDQGHTGSEADFLEWLKPSPEEIAQEVAPLLDVGNTVLTAEGTESLGKPDRTTVKALARRVAYAAPVKIATVTLSDGDNLIGSQNLSGDAVNLSSSGLYPRVLRNGSFISPYWSIQPDNKVLISNAVAGDVLYLCEYDISSGKKSNTNDRELWRRELADIGLNLVSGTFEEGATLQSASDALWHKSGSQCYIWKGAFPKSVAAGSSPSGSGGISSDAWVSVKDASLRQYLYESSIVTRTLKYFGAKGDGKTDDSFFFSAADAFSVSSGETIRVTKGDYLAKNITLSGTWVFDDDAAVIGNISGTDNVILAGTGLRMHNVRIKRTVSSYPIDGDYGNAIRIGTYRQPVGGSKHHDIVITAAKINCLGSINPQAVEMLGDVYDLHLEVDVYGPGGAVIAHWGGDVGDDGHNSAVTYTYHPHNLTLKVGGYPDEAGNAPENLLITSSCYNVKGIVRSRAVKRTLWVFPGDVYDAVAVDRDKSKVCTGIDIEVFAEDPVDSSSSPAIHLSGMPATPRTSPPANYAVDDTASMDYKIRGSIICGNKGYNNPVCIVEGIDSSNIDISRSGSAAGSGPWGIVRYSSRLKARMSGWAHQGVRVIGCPGSEIYISSICPLASDIDVARGAEVQNFVSGALITQYAIGPGAINAVVNPATAAVVFAGSYLTYLGVPVARVQKSMLCKAGVNTYIPIEAVTSTIPANSSVAFTLPCEGTRVTGCVEGYRNNYVLTNPWGLTLDISSKRSKQHSITINGNYVRGLKITGNIERTGMPSDTNYADIFVLSTTAIRGLDISCKFDAFATNPYVQTRFNYNGTNHTGVEIHDCYSSPCLSGVSFQIGNSTVAEAVNQAQIYGNKVDDAQAPGSVPTGVYLGGQFVGSNRNTVPPTDGYWQRGSRVYITGNVAAGGQEGHICTASGTPGTWKGFGSISA